MNMKNEHNEALKLHSSSFLTNDFPTDEQTNKTEESKLRFETDCKLILDELVDDALWELCFEVHRAAKLNYFFLEDPEKKNWGKVESSKYIVCPFCQKNKGTNKYTGHLAVCMGVETHRECSKKVKSFKDFDSDSNDSESFSPRASKKKSKRNKKETNKKTKSLGKSLSKLSPDNNSNYMDMSLDEKRTFFKQKCGVISKRTKKLCMKSHNCSVHTDKERRSVRDDLLRDVSDELVNNGQIDVDTVDEEIDMPSNHADEGSIPAIPVYQRKDVDLFSEAARTVVCPVCKKSKDTVKYSEHLANCMGGIDMSRNSFRKASQRIINFKECDSNSDDYTDSENFVPATSKKRNSFSKSSSETNANYQEMTYEKRKAFFNQMCGVISKRTNKMCMNTHKCSQHTDEQRRDVRHILLRDMGDQLTNDGQIDIDTVDEGSGKFSFISQTLPVSIKNLSSASGFMGENKSITSKNGAAHFRRKTGFSSTNAVYCPNQNTSTESSFDSI